MRTKLLIWITICLLGGGLLIAADTNPAYTSPAEAGPDFAVQGEYQGGAGEHKGGVQVVALGEGKFDVVGYRGGLPGEGWQRGDTTKRGAGELKDGVVEIKGEDWAGTIKGKVLTVAPDGKQAFELKKVERQSPTLGAQPPASAIVLFDGSTPDHFENGKLIEGSLLGATGCVSKQQFGDHSLHIEFRTPRSCR